MSSPHITCTMDNQTFSFELRTFLGKSTKGKNSHLQIFGWIESCPGIMNKKQAEKLKKLQNERWRMKVEGWRIKNEEWRGLWGQTNEQTNW